MNTRRNTERKTALLEEEARLKRLGFEIPERIRFRERSTVERVNSRIKDEFGGRAVRVRGHAKVFCHLMFGVLTLAADQLARMALSASTSRSMGARLAHPLAGAAEGCPENGNSKAWLISKTRPHRQGHDSASKTSTEPLPPGVLQEPRSNEIWRSS